MNKKYLSKWWMWTKILNNPFSIFEQFVLKFFGNGSSSVVNIVSSWKTFYIYFYISRYHTCLHYLYEGSNPSAHLCNVFWCTQFSCFLVINIIQPQIFVFWSSSHSWAVFTTTSPKNCLLSSLTIWKYFLKMMINKKNKSN